MRNSTMAEIIEMAGSYHNGKRSGTSAVEDLSNKIVIIDDNAEDFETLETFFNNMQEGQSVRNFTDASEFTENVEQTYKNWDNDQSLGVPRLVVLNISMENCNGIKVIQNIKSKPQYKDVPIILVAGQADEDKIEKAFALGASAFVSKPYNVRELMQAIHRSFNAAIF